MSLRKRCTHLKRGSKLRREGRWTLARHWASALDHTNICSIHEINETTDG